MAAWKKLAHGTSWPLYFDRDSMTATFGRFSVQPLPAGTAMDFGETLRAAMFEDLPGPSVVAFHFRLLADGATVSKPANAVLPQIKGWLNDLRVSTAARFPLVGKVRKRGPGFALHSDAQFSAAVTIVSSTPSMIPLAANETLELDFLIQWGKGRSAQPEALPRGWTSLDGCHSPVLSCNLDSSLIELGPNHGRQQLLVEIQTDGTVSPEDAIRRAGSRVRIPPLMPAS